MIGTNSVADLSDTGVIGSYVSLEGKVQVMEREVADDSILVTWASVYLRS